MSPMTGAQAPQADATAAQPLAVGGQAAEGVQSLQLGEAAKRDGTSSFVFLKDQWSQCPADTWVPALLEGVWGRARS